MLHGVFPRHVPNFNSGRHYLHRLPGWAIWSYRRAYREYLYWHLRGRDMVISDVRPSREDRPPAETSQSRVSYKGGP